MTDPVNQRRNRLPNNQRISRNWCCAFGIASQSPDNRSFSASRDPCKPPKSVNSSSIHRSPSPSSRISLGLIDPRRILSPGRVSPMNSDAVFSQKPVPERAKLASETLPRASPLTYEPRSVDLRLVLKGRDGNTVVLDLDSDVLCRNSIYFGGMVLEARRKAVEEQMKVPKIEITEIENLLAFKDTVELMFEKDASRWLMNAGVLRSINVLEVSCSLLLHFFAFD